MCVNPTPPVKPKEEYTLIAEDPELRVLQAKEEAGSILISEIIIGREDLILLEPEELEKLARMFIPEKMKEYSDQDVIEVTV